MDHAARVRVMQRLGALENDLDGIVDTQKVVGTAIGRKSTRAMHVLGHDITVTVLLARIEDRQDVRVLEHPDEMRLGEKHFAGDPRPLLVRAVVAVVNLDRHVAPVVRIV
jgi:hypothetical protein